MISGCLVPVPVIQYRHLFFLQKALLLREVIEGWIIGTRTRGMKRFGVLNECLKEASYAELGLKREKRKTGNSGEYGSQERA